MHPRSALGFVRNWRETFSVFLLNRPVFANPKSIQANVTLLERFPIILEKSTEEDLDDFILPLLFHALQSKMSQIQVSKNVFFFERHCGL